MRIVLDTNVLLISIPKNSKYRIMLLSALNVEKQDVFFKWQLIEIDKDDNKFVDCAIAGNAEYLVTNDKHFGVLNSIEFPPITIVNIDEFLELQTNNS